MGCLIALNFFSNAQTSSGNGNLEWGELAGQRGRLVEILPANGKDFYTLQYSGGAMLGNFFIARYDDLNFTKNIRIPNAVNNNVANFEKAIIIDGRPVVFLTNVRDGKEYVYLQQLSYDLESKSEPKLIATYDVPKGTTKTSINIIQSADRKHFAVLWLLVAKKKESDIYGYAVFDEKMQEVDKGEYEVPFESRYSEITNHFLTNDGNYFFILKEFEPNPERGGGTIYKAMHLFQAEQSIGLEQYTFNVEGKRIEAISVNSDNDAYFAITGLYGNNQFPGAKGVFHMKLDFANAEVISESYQEFDRSFLVEDYTSRERDRMDRFEERGRSEPGLYNFNMRESILLDDGSTIAVMEQEYVVVVRNIDSRSMVTYTYRYYYNDIILVKINEHDEIEWIQKIRKNQVSSNDGGPYSSFASTIVGNQLKIFFNDSKNNYDESGRYIQGMENYTKFSARSNVVANVEVDLASGLVNRSTMFTRKESGALARPKLFKVDRDNKQMLIYTSLKGKERFGILNGN